MSALTQSPGPGGAAAGALSVGAEVAGLAAPTAGPPPSSRRGRSRLGRGGAYLVTLFVLVSLNFALPRAMPGDPISALVDTGSPSRVRDDALRGQLAHYYGLDRPLVAQYASYLRALAHGDVGTSIRYHLPVSRLLRDRLPPTLLLISVSMALAVGIGWAAGVHSGWRRGRRVDGGLLALFLGLRSFPVFFVGSLALLVFSVHLGWLPLSGARTAFAGSAGLAATVGDTARHLVLPAGVLALQFVGSQYLVMRAGIVGELGADYLLLGRAKGTSERRLKYAYAARNGLGPAVTLVAIHLGLAVTESVLVETVFAYPGVGRLVFDSISYRDYPVLQGCFLALAVTVVSANFAADAIAARLDPRIGP